MLWSAALDVIFASVIIMIVIINFMEHWEHLHNSVSRITWYKQVPFVLKEKMKIPVSVYTGTGMYTWMWRYGVIVHKALRNANWMLDEVSACRLLLMTFSNQWLKFAVAYCVRTMIPIPWSQIFKISFFSQEWVVSPTHWTKMSQSGNVLDIEVWKWCPALMGKCLCNMWWGHSCVLAVATHRLLSCYKSVTSKQVLSFISFSWMQRERGREGWRETQRKEGWGWGGAVNEHKRVVCVCVCVCVCVRVCVCVLYFTDFWWFVLPRKEQKVIMMWIRPQVLHTAHSTSYEWRKYIFLFSVVIIYFTYYGHFWPALIRILVDWQNTCCNLALYYILAAFKQKVVSHVV